MIEDSIFINPLPLLNITNKDLIKKIDSYLPYSSAFEVECMKQPTFNIQAFKEIPDIMDVNCDCSEQRFRVPSGLKGLVCLWYVAEQLKLNSELNPESGIHYHVDCTDIWSMITPNLRKENTEWILNELDTWDPEYTAHSRQLGSWFKFNDLKTMEFRVGEMTFDYPILAKRMIHCNEIVRKFKMSMAEGIHRLELEQLQNKLNELKSKKVEEVVKNEIYKDIAQDVVRNRTKRI